MASLLLQRIILRQMLHLPHYAYAYRLNRVYTMLYFRLYHLLADD